MVLRVEKGDGWELRLGDCLDPDTGLASLGAVDHVITDPPYSARTHSGHDDGARTGTDGARRKELGYSAWTPAHVTSCVEASVAAGAGWIVAMSDHVLAPHWHSAMESCGRYTFAPIPWYAPGSRVRLAGDGPSTWVVWITVSRPSSLHRWGTLPGGYHVTGDREHMGGKPLALMEALVRDYSRQGELVCDPCVGSGTTGVACIRLGRCFVGWEKDPGYFETAVKRLRAARPQGDLFERAGFDGKPQTLPGVE